MPGTLGRIQRGYAGSVIRDGVLHFAPRLRGRLDGLAFSMRFRGMLIHVKLEGGELTVAADAEGLSRPIQVGAGEEVVELCPVTATPSPSKMAAATTNIDRKKSDERAGRLSRRHLRRRRGAGRLAARAGVAGGCAS